MPSEPLLAAKGLTRSPGISAVDLALDRGRTVGLVGPSGSGKSTLARCLARFDPPDSGEVLFEGRPLTRICPEIQLVLQQPAAALNPRFTAEEVIAEPLLIQKRAAPAACRKRAAELMESLSLPRAAASRSALSFSGGERQRLALARALVLEPKVLILDESFAGLDLSVRAQIAQMLAAAQQRTAAAYLLIAHDLRLVEQLADEIAVMESGAIVERGPTAEIMAHPRHPQTKRMIEAAAALSLRGAGL